jgi:hypothetical protein
MSPIDTNRLTRADGFANAGQIDLSASEDEKTYEEAMVRAVRAIGSTLQAIFEIQRGQYPYFDPKPSIDQRRRWHDKTGHAFAFEGCASDICRGVRPVPA